MLDPSPHNAAKLPGQIMSGALRLAFCSTIAEDTMRQRDLEWEKLEYYWQMLSPRQRIKYTVLAWMVETVSNRQFYAALGGLFVLMMAAAIIVPSELLKIAAAMIAGGCIVAAILVWAVSDFIRRDD